MDRGTPGELQIGATFNRRYRVVRRLRVGGMGAIYEVVQHETRRRRALKVMLPGLADDRELRARFEREATIAAAVHSEHIVEVLDAGVDADSGMPFIVMELLTGVDLAQLLAERGRLGASEVIALLRQAARAIDQTHAAGVLHRDLKPQNLFLTHRDDGSPRLKVLDFGIARLAAADKSTMVLGSPLYMAPEQIQGERSLGPAVDIYALAQVAFTLLTGEPYWASEQRAADNTFAMLIVMTRGAPQPATTRAAALGAPLPAAVDAWFARAAHLDPAQRHPSGEALVTDLALALAEPLDAPTPGTLQVTAFPPSDPGTVFEPPPRRARWFAGLALATLGLGAWGLWPDPAPTTAAPPTTCAEVRRADPNATDGEYTLTLDVGERIPLRVYCRDMAGEPREYLTLPRSRASTGEYVNCSHYANRDGKPPHIQCFTRVRLLTAPLAIDVNDETYTDDNGVPIGENNATKMHFAAAGDCIGNESTQGRGSVDLRGTPLSVLGDQFTANGWRAAGAATYSHFNQRVDLIGGGHCGGFSTPERPTHNSSWGPAGPLRLGLAHHVFIVDRPSPAGDVVFQSGATGPDRLDRWSGLPTPRPQMMVNHDGQFYALLANDSAPEAPALYLHTGFTVRIDAQWRQLTEFGSFTDTHALTSHRGHLYVAANDRLATIDLTTITDLTTINPTTLTTLPRSDAGPAPRVRALSSAGGILHAIADDRLLRCIHADADTPLCTRWDDLGPVAGQALTAHEGALLMSSGNRLLRREPGGSPGDPWQQVATLPGNNIFAMVSTSPDPVSAIPGPSAPKLHHISRIASAAFRG